MDENLHNNDVKSISETLKENAHLIPKKDETSGRKNFFQKNIRIIIATLITVTVIFAMLALTPKNIETVEETTKETNSAGSEYETIDFDEAKQEIEKTIKKSQNEYFLKGGFISYLINNPNNGLEREIVYHYAPSVLEELSVTYDVKNKTDFSVNPHDVNTDIFGLEKIDLSIYSSAYRTSEGITLTGGDGLYEYGIKINSEGLVTEQYRKETVGNVEKYSTASVIMTITYGESAKDIEIVTQSTQ